MKHIRQLIKNENNRQLTKKWKKYKTINNNNNNNKNTRQVITTDKKN